MPLLDSMPIGVLAVFVFGLRVIDVTLGTMRTISVVHGRTRTAAALGFVEILIWVAAVAQVLAKLSDHPSLAIFYAGGFAAGNAVGILIERRLAMGTCVVTMISKQTGPGIAEALREIGQRVTTIDGEGRDGPRQMLYVTAKRRDLKCLIAAARAIEPDVFYVVQFTSDTTHVAGLAFRDAGRKYAKRK